MMRAEGLARPGAPDSELVLDMYRLLARTPSQVVLAMPADAVGDLRQPNLPGTRDEYPNWRLPSPTPPAPKFRSKPSSAPPPPPP